MRAADDPPMTWHRALPWKPAVPTGALSALWSRRANSMAFFDAIGPAAISSSPDQDNAAAAPRRYRTIWISDVHLGTRDAKAEYLADFLRHSQADILYLVGDIIDGWRLKRSWYWVPSHEAVIREVLHKARNGTRVIYVPGNHDEMLRDYVGIVLGGVAVMGEVVHETADGRRLLVIHGDQFDGIFRCARWLTRLGDHAYKTALALNRWFNLMRRRLGLPYWSLSAYLKHRVKNAVAFIADFETALAYEARRRGVDGVVCGHIHHAEIRDIDGVLYANSGDWVEGCSALVERGDGELAIVRWTCISQDSAALMSA